MLAGLDPCAMKPRIAIQNLLSCAAEMRIIATVGRQTLNPVRKCDARFRYGVRARLQ